MPISRKEFEEGKPDPAYALLEIFRSTPDTAYSESELLAILQEESAITSADLVAKLRELVRKEQIESKEIQGVIYYIYRRTLGFRLPGR
jgi:hypothetical protein